MKRFFLFAILALTTPLARANDGSVTWGDAPQLTTTHASVSMQSEVVRLIVGREGTRVDCRFVFVNHGPACTVRMGFPDHSDDDADSRAQRFRSFRSYVDGREVATRSVLGPLEDGERVKWRVKAVKFGAEGTSSATRKVRDVYTVDLFGDPQIYASVASYTLHTGSSWRGSIGRSEIIVTFPDWHGPFHAIPRRKADSEVDMKRLQTDMARPGTLAYKGPGRAIVRGQVIRWVRTNWRPTYEDDIQIFFHTI